MVFDNNENNIILGTMGKGMNFGFTLKTNGEEKNEKKHETSVDNLNGKHNI